MRCCLKQQMWWSLLLGWGLTVGLLMLWPPQDHRVHAAAGEVYCVVPAEGAAGPFVACDRVFTTVQRAVDASSGGEEIRVAGGVYPGVQQRAGVTQSVYLSQTVTVRGGYTVPFTSPPDPAANPTILDAQGQGRVFYISGDISPTIAGLNLTGGNATDLGGFSTTEADTGGGLYAVSATVTLSGNTIYGNVASESRFGFGGGVYLTAAEAILEGNTIRDNLGSCVDDGVGGGLAVYQSQARISNNKLFSNTASLTATFFGVGGGIGLTDSFADLFHNEIMSNTALISGSMGPGFPFPNGFGGGISIYNSESYLFDNTIRGNIAHDIGAGYGGGLALQSERPITVNNNLIQGNVASRSALGDGIGGGVSILSPASVTMAENLILDNMAAISGTISLGGGLAAHGPEPTRLKLSLAGNTVQNNTAGVFSDIGAGGGLFLCCRASLKHNTIISNTALVSETQVFTSLAVRGGLGGGIYLGEGQAHLDGDLILGNTGGHSSEGRGGGMYVDDSQVVLTNTVIGDNVAPTTGAGLVLGWNTRADLLHVTLARNRGGDGGGLLVTERSVSPNVAPTPNTVALTNTILVSHAIGISVSGAHTVTVNGILWFDTPLTVSASPTASLSIANEVTGDPVFAPDGYHLRPGSAAFERGVAAGVLLDIDGEPRSPLPDLGADELLLILDERFYLPPIFSGQ